MDHVRIDEGFKRGKRKKTPDPNRTSAGIPRTSVARRRNEQGQVQAIPPDLDPDVVLEQYLHADTTSQIAKQYGVTRKSLTQWLRKVRPAEWKQVQIIRAHDMKDQANDELPVASDPLSLARTREMLKSAQWELQALDDDYKVKQEVTMTLNVDLGDRLRRAKDREIDITPAPQQIESKE